jgi:O-antigen/teichoic acid export membrane protein
VLAIRCAPWLSFRFSDFDPDAIRRTWTAAFGFFCIHVCTNLINLHVPRLIVAYSLGPAALSIFTVFITYTRAARNFALMASQATQVEIGKAFAKDGREAARELLTPMLRSALLGAGLLLTAELALAPIVIPAWTHGLVAVDWPLLAAAALVAFVGTYFDATLVAASAFNRVAAAAIFYAAGLVVGIGAALALLPWLGLVAVAGVGMLAPEVIGAFGATMTIRSVFNKSR